MSDSSSSAAAAPPAFGWRTVALPAVGRRVIQIVWAISATCAAALVGVAVWGLSRGFDVTDEGYYVLSYQHRQPPTWGLSRFDVLEKALLGWMHPDVVALRTIHLAMVVISSIVLAIGLAAYRPGRSRRLAHDSLIWLPFIVIAQMAAYAYGPPTLSYNTEAVFVVMTVLGATLLYASTPGGRICLSMPVLSGFLLGLCLFVKFPSSMSALLVTLIALALMRPPSAAASRRGRAEPVIALLAGYSLGAAFYFLIAESPAVWWSALTAGLSDSSAQGHATGGLVSSDAVAAVHTATSLLEGALILMAALLAYRRRGNLSVLAKSGLALVLAAASIVWLYHLKSSVGSSGVLPLAYLVGLEVIVAGLFIDDRAWRSVWGAQPDRYWVGCALALAMPICGAVGTNNELLGQTMILLGGWAVALALVSGLRRSGRQVFVMVTVMAVLGILSVAKFERGYVAHPYRLVAGLTAQTVTIGGSGPLAHLSVDPDTATFFARLESVRERYNLAGRPMIGMYDLPGVILALGGYAPGYPFVDDFSKVLTCQDLVRLRPVDPVLLIVRNSTQGPPLGCLSESGINLARYHRLASIYDPYQARQLEILAVPGTVRKA